MMGAWGCWVGDQSSGIGQSWVLGRASIIGGATPMNHWWEDSI